jgi:alkaline phosphatase D
MLSRRQFLVRSGAAGAAVVVAPQSALTALAEPRARAAALLRGGAFRQGVLSGEPTPSGITLLTVLDEVSGPGSVRLEIARDPGFRRVVARRAISTRGAIGHSVKARVERL